MNRLREMSRSNGALVLFGISAVLLVAIAAWCTEDLLRPVGLNPQNETTLTWTGFFIAYAPTVLVGMAALTVFGMIIVLLDAWPTPGEAGRRREIARLMTWVATAITMFAVSIPLMYHKFIPYLLDKSVSILSRFALERHPSWAYESLMGLHSPAESQAYQRALEANAASEPVYAYWCAAGLGALVVTAFVMAILIPTVEFINSLRPSQGNRLQFMGWRFRHPLDRP